MFTKISTGVRRQIIISSCLYLGQIINGYSTAWSGPVIPKLRELDQSPLPYLLTETQLSFVATVIYLGCVLGPFFVNWLSNITGRKPCLILSGLVMIVAYIVLATTQNVAMLYVGRFLAGVSGGSTTVLNIVYIGEIASTNIRGILLTAFGVFTTVGSFLLFATGPYVSYHETAYIALVINAVYVLGLIFIPDSPIFYVIQGRDEEVKKVLKDLDRTEDINEVLRMTKNQTNTDINTRREWKELFTLKSNRKALFIGVVINIFQHSSGTLAVVFFSAAIFDMAGSSIDSSIAMIIVSCFQLTGSVVTPFFIESFGRKIILIISSTVCSLCMFILGMYFYLDQIGTPFINSVKWLPLLILILFHIGYDSGLGIIPNAIVGEMFTADVRSKGSTVSMTISWIFGFAVTTTFGAFLKIVGGHVTFWFFSSTCACAVIFTVIFIPETKRKTLTQIQEIL